MKRGTPRHKKMHALAVWLGIPLYGAVGIMEMLWHQAATYTPEGDIGNVPDEEIAAWVSWPKKTATLIDALVATQWLDRSETHRLLIHDWPDHCEYEVRRSLIRKKKDFVPEYARSVHDKIPESSRQSPGKFRESSGKVPGNGAPSREALAKAEAVVVFGEEVQEKGRKEIAVIERPTPMEILEELKPIYHRAGLPIPPKHEQLSLQLLIGIPAEKRQRIPNYVKHALFTGKWRGPSTTKSLLNLLRDGDWDVDIVERTLPDAPTKEHQDRERKDAERIQRAQRILERRAAGNV